MILKNPHKILTLLEQFDTRKYPTQWTSSGAQNFHAGLKALLAINSDMKVPISVTEYSGLSLLIEIETICQ